MIARRSLLAGAMALAAPLPGIVRAQTGFAADRQSPQPRTPAALIEAARQRAAQPWQSRAQALAAPFDRLDYDRYRGVRPVPGRAAGLPLGGRFRADLLPPGWLFDTPVQIALPGHDTRFAADMFSLDPALITVPDPMAPMSQMGYSGLRLQTPLNQPDRWDEVLVVQGASYFRALARDTVYGLSARALALGTGGPGPEEFPVTTDIAVFDAGESVHFGCLIDSPRAAAALVARLRPGVVTRMACSLHLFARTRLSDAGIAPLTSMFQHSPMGPARIDDFRPAVHDSDVLVIDNGAGERLWRPLANPAWVQMSAFVDTGPRGYGLLQSPTRFDAFRDAEARYHLRPSAWVRPRSDWGQGAVMLLEIPTRDEFADNIVAFWRPDAPLAPGAHRFDYDLDWLAPGPERLPPARLPLVPVHLASGIEPNARSGRLFVIDFAAGPGAPPTDTPPTDTPPTDTLPTDALRVDIAPVAGARIDGVALYPLADPAVSPGLLRLSFVLTPDAATDTAELRLSLRGPDGTRVSPVWLYRWTRTAGGGA